MISRAASAAVFAALFAALLQWLSLKNPGQWNTGVPLVEFSLLAVAAYTVSALLCDRIAGEHQATPAMRLAWLLLSWSCWASVIRHAIFAARGMNVDPWARGIPGYITTQTPMTISLLLLLAGLLAMWRAMASLGLGFHARKLDLALFILIVVAIPPILLSEGVQRPVSDNLLVLVFRYAGAILLPAVTAVGVLLHRIVVEMRGGQLAKALRCLILFSGIRLLALMIAVNPPLKSVPGLQAVSLIALAAVPFVFTLAAAYRWQITLSARQELEEQERLPVTAC